MEPMIRIEHIGIAVKDLAAAEELYATRLLGVEATSGRRWRAKG
jgi:catechol 2,3-dioxygenase-like lactoylglutathione lyase family enzyme